MPELIFKGGEAARVRSLEYSIEKYRNHIGAWESEKKRIRDRARQRALREAAKEQSQ